jgi:hypothetical protein
VRCQSMRWEGPGNPGSLRTKILNMAPGASLAIGHSCRPRPPRRPNIGAVRNRLALSKAHLEVHLHVHLEGSM